MAANPHQTAELRAIRSKRPRAGWRRAAVLAGVAWLAALAVNRSLVEVRGSSMLPTLWPGDRVLSVPMLGPARPGTVVVVRHPADPDHLVVKRVRTVGPDGVDVRGDHAAASTDSRHFGRLPRAAVRRRVVRRWPDLRSPLTAPAGCPETLRPDGRR
jgi:nickel-type superoxide dismutase maturation protease